MVRVAAKRAPSGLGVFDVADTPGRLHLTGRSCHGVTTMAAGRLLVVGTSLIVMRGASIPVVFPGVCLVRAMMDTLDRVKTGG